MKASTFLSTLFILKCLDSCLSNNLAFDRLGKFRGKNQENLFYEKSFYIPKHFRATWQVAFTLCKSFNMELATFDSLAESEFVKERLTNFPIDGTNWIHIGGMTRTGKSTIDWYWIHTDEKIDFTLEWHPGQPSFHRNQQYCLAFGTKNVGAGKYADIDCHTHHHSEAFLCQVVESIE